MRTVQPDKDRTGAEQQEHPEAVHPALLQGGALSGGQGGRQTSQSHRPHAALHAQSQVSSHQARPSLLSQANRRLSRLRTHSPARHSTNAISHPRLQARIPHSFTLHQHHFLIISQIH